MILLEAAMKIFLEKKMMNPKDSMSRNENIVSLLFLVEYRFQNVKVNTKNIHKNSVLWTTENLPRNSLPH